MKTQSWILTLLISALALLPLACTENPTAPGKVAGDPITSLTAVRNINNSNFYYPAQIQYSNGALWIINEYGQGLMKMDPGGSLIKNITSFNGSSFFYPWGVNTDPNGRVFVADYDNSAVEVFNGLNGAYLTQVDPNQLSGTYPNGVVATSDTLYVLTYYSSMGILAFPMKGNAAPTFGNPTTICAGLFANNPYCIRMDHSGNLWIADTGNHRLLEVDKHGSIMKNLNYGGSSFGPTDMAFDQGNNIYVTNQNANDIVIFKANGDEVATVTSGGLSSPEGIATDNHGTFYVSDYNNYRVVVYH